MKIKFVAPLGEIPKEFQPVESKNSETEEKQASMTLPASRRPMSGMTTMMTMMMMTPLLSRKQPDST